MHAERRPNPAVLTAMAVVAAVAAGACATAPPRLEHARMASAALGHEMRYAVYAPSDRDRSSPLPLVVFLHGGGDDSRCFDDAGVGEMLDRAMAAGQAPKAVIVVPEGDLGFWTNWADGSHRYEDWVVQDLVPEVARRYATMPCPEGCHVSGISMGGIGALRMAFHHPEIFGSVTSISGPILDARRMVEFSNSFFYKNYVGIGRIFGPVDDPARLAKEDLFVRWSRAEDLRGTRLFVAWGTDDRPGVIESNRAFDTHLRAHGIPHRSLVFAGGHRWSAWRGVIVPMLRFAVLGEMGDAAPGGGK